MATFNIHGQGARFRRFRGHGCDVAEAKRVTPGGPRAADEVGASLVLALLFLVVIGLIVGGLASWTANDLSNAVVFQNARSAEFALNSATQLAIQNIRYVPLISSNSVLGTDETLNASPPEYCWGSGPGTELTTQGDTVAVWCSTQWNPASTTTRKVTIVACLISPSVSITTSNWQALSTGCATNPSLETVVSFDDYESNLSSTSPCTSTCGTGMTIDSSSAGPTNPTVTGLSTTPATSPPSGPVTGGTALTITGSGFVSGLTTVFLVDPSVANLVITIPPGSVTFNSSTSISVTTPGVTTSANYNVAVSTPNGNSLDGPQFAYQPVIPTISSMTPTTGSANGGTALIIDGTGFLANSNGDLTNVTFTDTANSAITATAPDLSVNSTGTVITATTPSITTEATYYVTVTTTPGGTTAQSASFEFTFQPYYPVADSITPTSGNSGTVTVTGLGFLSGGTTVTLIPTTGGGSGFSLTGVSVSSSTSLTAQIPTGEPVATYYVSIITTWNGTQYQSCNSTGSGGIPSCSSEGAPTYQY